MVIQGPERDHGLREQSRSEREVVHRRLVPHRRSGLSSTPTAICTLVARIKELINRGGEKISPREIDEVLLAHPAVAEAVCFGVPHATWGEEVAAAVVAARAGQPKRSCSRTAKSGSPISSGRSRSTSPRAIPRTATGKIQRRRRGEGVRQPRRRENSSSPAPARSAATSARGSRARAPTSCCSRAARICTRCRSAGCASSAPTAISR